MEDPTHSAMTEYKIDERVETVRAAEYEALRGMREPERVQLADRAASLELGKLTRSKSLKIKPPKPRELCAVLPDYAMDIAIIQASQETGIPADVIRLPPSKCGKEHAIARARRRAWWLLRLAGYSSPAIAERWGSHVATVRCGLTIVRAEMRERGLTEAT